MKKYDNDNDNATISDKKVVASYKPLRSLSIKKISIFFPYFQPRIHTRLFTATDLGGKDRKKIEHIILELINCNFYTYSAQNVVFCNVEFYMFEKKILMIFIRQHGTL